MLKATNTDKRVLPLHHLNNKKKELSLLTVLYFGQLRNGLMFLQGEYVQISDHYLFTENT